ncbi:hypothetical protein J8V57_06740 [Xenorhabdus sp. PB61.4]|uniref:hypothetical protein n=1 Tax=Xenorhabdus sp. PB61.4 TaxID=2788940 RepID=UPI001E350F3C|nr:hypothetical protein [Xenorhabdus sp. PB61.4]MCC8365978.1 hypothetical protein [Xenorhabdus sp. PB61.4]
MLKKFFIGGSLVTVMSLTVGIATAAAESLCPNESVYISTKPNYTRVVVKPNRNFSQEFIQQNTMYGDIQWFYQGPQFSCIDKAGKPAWAAVYIGNSVRN